MKNLQVFFSVIILIFILSIAFFAQATQKSGFVGISPTPTIDLTQSFQLIQPPGSSQQAQQSQQVLQAQTAQIPPTTIPLQPTPTVGVQAPPPASVSAVIKTSKGDINVILYGSDAPNTVNNFMNKAKSGYYNNLTFHRVESWVVQGGDPHGDGTGGGQMPAEATTKPFVTGSIGVARASDPKINNDSQFFITKSDASWLNGLYTNFGMVTSGMDVVNQLQIGDKILGITINTPNIIQSEGGLPENP